MPRITDTIEALSEKLGGSAEVTAPAAEAHTECDVVVRFTDAKAAALKKLLTDTQWTTAILVFERDAASKWGGGTGAAQLRAEWSPWFEFSPAEHEPADGALVLNRRTASLLDWENHQAYQHLVERIFSGKGKGIGRIAALTVGPVAARKWVEEAGVSPTASAGSLAVEQWVQLYQRTHDETGRPATGNSIGPAHGVNQASGTKAAPMRKVRW